MPRIFLLIVVSSLLYAQMISYDIKPSWLGSNQFMKINILDSKELVFGKFSGIEVCELSDLSYDSKTLYALSDRGYLYHFDIQLDQNNIKEVELKKAFKLKSKNEKALKKGKIDSEGMVYVDGSLVISFEHEPRVEQFSLDGNKEKSIKIDKNLRNIKKYQDENKALEAVAYNKKYGVVTAPEQPLRGENSKFHTLYGKNNTWEFPACGSITALEFMDENTILVLERDFSKKNLQFIVTLSKVHLDKCEKQRCESEVLATLDSKQGWKIDNFEGLTKVRENTFLMISDDNGMFFQKTLLVLFELQN